MTKEDIQKVIEDSEREEKEARERYLLSRDFTKRMKKMAYVFEKASSNTGTFMDRVWKKVYERAQAQVEDAKYRTDDPVGYQSDQLVVLVGKLLSKNPKVNNLRMEIRLKGARYALSRIINNNQGRKVEEARELYKKLSEILPAEETKDQVLNVVQKLVSAEESLVDPKKDSLELGTLKEISKEVKKGVN